MQVWINGVSHELTGDARVPDALRALGVLGGGVPSRGVAVAVDGEVVPRAVWADSVLRDGARVEVLTAVQGG